MWKIAVLAIVCIISHSFCFFFGSSGNSGNVEFEGCHFVFYGVVGDKVDCCVSGGWFSVYINFEICLFACYSQVKKVYGAVVFVGGVEPYVIMYLIYVCVDGMRVDFRYVVYDQNVIYVSCV